MTERVVLEFHIEVTLECLEHGHRDRLLLWFGGSPGRPVFDLFSDELVKARLLVLNCAGVVLRALLACQHGQIGAG